MRATSSCNLNLHSAIVRLASYFTRKTINSSFFLFRNPRVLFSMKCILILLDIKIEITEKKIVAIKKSQLRVKNNEQEMNEFKL